MKLVQDYIAMLKKPEVGCDTLDAPQALSFNGGCFTCATRRTY